MEKKLKIEKWKQDKGITLVALVITIIVMLILTGVVLMLTMGDNGIFSTAKEAGKQQKIAEYIEKVELSRGQVALDNLGKVDLDKLIEQIYKDKVVERGSITKQEDNKTATMVTKEGYIFTITEEGISYIGTGGQQGVGKQEGILEATDPIDGKITLKIRAGIPSDHIQKIEIYDETNTIIQTFQIPTGIQQIEKEISIYMPFYEEKTYHATITGNNNTFDTNSITPQENTNIVATAKDLQKLATLVNTGKNTFEGITIKQVENIDLSSISNSNSKSWEGIGYNSSQNPYWFNGTYDGAGKEITGLYINNTENKTIGLFGFLGHKGTVKNVTLYGNVTQNVNGPACGAIVGRNEGTIENCVNNAEVTITGVVAGGGIAGYHFGSIKNCINNGKINSVSAEAGGIIGAFAYTTEEILVSENGQKVGNEVSIINCINKAVVQGEKFAGGICGRMSIGKITSCTNEGNVIVKENSAGGITAESLSGTEIIKCKNIGNILSNGNPEAQSNTQGTGGIVGRLFGLVSNSSNEADITSKGYFTGGIAGLAKNGSVIKKSYNYNANIETQQNSAGGIVGRTDGTTIENCYNYLSNEYHIKAEGENAGGIAGIIGSNSNYISNCYSVVENLQSKNLTYRGVIAGYCDVKMTISKTYYLNTSTFPAIGAGAEPTKNDLTAKTQEEFQKNVTDIASVTYLLNNNEDIWGQNIEVNGGYPYIK